MKQILLSGQYYDQLEEEIQTRQKHKIQSFVRNVLVKWLNKQLYFPKEDSSQENHKDINFSQAFGDSVTKREQYKQYVYVLTGKKLGPAPYDGSKQKQDIIEDEGNIEPNRKRQKVEYNSSLFSKTIEENLSQCREDMKCIYKNVPYEQNKKHSEKYVKEKAQKVYDKIKSALYETQYFRNKFNI